MQFDRHDADKMPPHLIPYVQLDSIFMACYMKCICAFCSPDKEGEDK